VTLSSGACRAARTGSLRASRALRPIDPADITAVAALALTRDGHQGLNYVLTGDESLTIAEQVAICQASGAGAKYMPGG
jgi:uncharacterized protein YbjT (DUF2867 family)